MRFQQLRGVFRSEEKTARKKPTFRRHLLDLGEAMYDYDANDGEELSFREGDRLEVTDKESDDWWMAKNTSGSTGLIPSNYVKETSAPSKSSTSSSSSSSSYAKPQRKKIAFTSTKSSSSSSSSNQSVKKTKKKSKKKSTTTSSSTSKPKKANFLASIQNVKSAKGQERAKKSRKKKSNETKNRDRRRIAIESMMTADAVGCDDMVRGVLVFGVLVFECEAREPLFHSSSSFDTVTNNWNHTTGTSSENSRTKRLLRIYKWPLCNVGANIFFNHVEH